MHPVEARTLQFYAWEQRGRGWALWAEPVDLEPPYIPPQYFPLRHSSRDDEGKSHTLFSYLTSSLSGPKISQEDLGLEYFEPSAFQYEGYQVLDKPQELSVILPAGYQIQLAEAEQLLILLAGEPYPLSFEIIIQAEQISLQFAGAPSTIQRLQFQLQAYFPQAVVEIKQDQLLDLWDTTDQTAIVDLGLEQEFMRPLHMVKSFSLDPHIGMFGACEQISAIMKSGELGVIQVLFQGTINPWSAAIMSAVSDGKGGSFFSDDPDMINLAKEKTASPMFSVVLRVVGQSTQRNRAGWIANTLIDSLRVVNNPGSNSLIPLSNEGYDFREHEWNVLQRQTNRLGMLLNSRELVSLVHLPGANVQAPKLQRLAQKTKAAPETVLGHSMVLGTNVHMGISRTISLSVAHRVRHTHCVGVSGTGKSTLLLSKMIQDAQQGTGLCLLDPHGDLVEDLLPHIPPERLDDVIILDPADIEYPIGLNLLEANTEGEKLVLSSDLVEMFKRLATSWGDQMTSVLSNAVDAFLESTQGGSLMDLRRFLVEKSFRNQFLETVTDPGIVYYWQNEFPQLKGGSIASLLTRLNAFLRPKIIRYMVGQRTGLNFDDILNNRKIFLVKLSHGLIGESNSYLLGTLIVAKLHQAAQKRQTLPKDQRLPFYLYIDEFQNFIIPSMESILSGARKYGLGLVLAHQDLQQLFKEDAKLANSVISNPGTRICFRIGDFDAKKLEGGFSFFDASDLQNLGIGQAIMRVGQSEHDFNISTNLPAKIPDAEAEERRQEALARSRATYARSREELDLEMAESYGISETAKPKTKPVSKPEVPPKPPKPTIPQPPPQKPEETPPLVPTEPGVPKGKFEAAAEEYIAQETKRKAKSDHRYLQTLIKRLAESYGYKATIEAPTPDETGRVDVSLERDDDRIACEISVTNTKEYEVQNIQKCLQAKYSKVIMCSKNVKHLAAIEDLAKETLSAKDIANVLFLHPDEISYWLTNQSIERPQTEKRIKGYRVKVNYTSVDAKEAARKQQKLTEVVLKAMRDKGKK